MDFKSARLTAGLSQRQLAEDLGVDRSLVCLWESGSRQPGKRLLVPLFERLGLSDQDLVKYLRQVSRQ